MSRNRGSITSLVVALCLVLAACGGDSNEAEGDAQSGQSGPDVINFQLNWFPGAAFAPFYVALHKGWYEDANLAVNIVDGTGSGEAVRRVDIGQADIAIADAGVVINAVRGGADMKVVMMLADESVQGIFTKSDSGIDGVEDMEGALVGAPPEDAARLLMPAVAAAAGIDHGLIEYVDIQPVTKYAVLETGEVDAVFDIAQNAPLIWEALGGKENSTRIDFADYGIDLYSLSVFTRDDVLAERSDALERFLMASRRGWQFALANPEETIEIYQEYHSHIDFEDELEVLNLWIPLMQSDNYRENGIGWIDPDKMESTIEIVQEYFPNDGGLEDLDDASRVMTNELLSEKIELP